jgi:hypothetical protein
MMVSSSPVATSELLVIESCADSQPSSGLRMASNLHKS